MKKNLIAAALIALAVASCNRSESVSTTPLEQYTENLLSQFPNYESNEIARNSMNDSIKAHARSQIGSIPTDLSGLKFNFEEIKEGNDTCVATFLATGYASIDAPANSKTNTSSPHPALWLWAKLTKPLPPLLTIKSNIRLVARCLSMMQHLGHTPWLLTSHSVHISWMF